jgi:alanyl-tRNA synthetase
MTTIARFEADAYATDLDTEVLYTGEADGRVFAVLADTIFYPAGGGQPADHGTIGGVAVLDVERRAGEIRHHLDGSVPTGATRLRLDWSRRFDHMQQHTAQHLLTAVAQDRFGWATTAFHLGAELSDVELEAGAIDHERITALEDAVAAEVRAARAVSARCVSPEALRSLAVRTRGLPAGHRGDVRLVEIAGIDLNTCGGTHVRSTAELEAVALLHTEPMRGGTRLHFVAGGRLRRRLAAHERRNAELRTILGAPDDEFAGVAQLRSEQLREAERRARHLGESLVEAVASELAVRDATVVDAHFEGRDAPFLAALGRALARRSPAKAFLLTAAGASGVAFLVGSGDALEADVQAAGRAVAAALGGRGGGSGRSFQGKAGSLDGREAAVAVLRSAVSA